MPAPARRHARMPVTSKGLATRERLVQAAVDCFRAQGYTATSVADITAAAGTSHGSFYRYFEHVDDVLLAAVDGPLDELFGDSRRPAPDEATSFDAVAAWHTSFLRAYAPHRAVFAIMREAAAVDRGTGFSAVWLDLRSRFVREIEAWIGDVEAVLGPDPAGASASDLAAVLGAMAEQVAHVHIGVAPVAPTDGEIRALAQLLAVIAHRAVTEARR